MGNAARRALIPMILAAWSLVPFPASADGDECFYCGMRRADYGYSWVEIQYANGSIFGFCSLHCASIHMALHPERVPSHVRVGDYLSRRLVDADEAYWVIGGNKVGVMTARAKWAFSNKADAERFVAENGGRLATMDEAAKAATEDMYRDISAIQKKRNATRTETMDRNRE